MRKFVPAVMVALAMAGCATMRGPVAETGRTLTMLGVVPEWFRLLIWPHHLQADYSPQEILPAEHLSSPQLLGLVLLAIAVLLLVATWRRQPVVAFGVLWLGIGIGPVHNVLVPTGIVLAERTLFGEPVRKTLAEIAERVDLVDVFRRGELIPQHVEDLLAMKPRPKVVWFQLGIRNDDVAKILEAAGITVVQNRCTLAEHQRLGLGAPSRP